MLNTALILLGHGSHISPNTAGIVWEAVDALRALGVADEVTAAFWKEQPSFYSVLGTVAAPDVTLVPLFTAQGYFTRTVIPNEMGLTGDLTGRDGRLIRYAQPLGNHPYLGQLLAQRITDTLQAYNLAPQETAVAIIGHGTRRNPESRHATEAQASALRDANLSAETVAAYLDDSPNIPDIYRMTSQPNLIVLPFFLALGSHTSLDVPRALGLEEGQTVAEIQGRRVHYALPVGVNEALTPLILDLARQVGTPLREAGDHTTWDNFPSVGRDALFQKVEREKSLIFGELLLTPSEVRHKEDAGNQDLTPLHDPAELRRRLRENPFRPLSTATNLPRGWKVEILPRQPERLFAVVETIYPGVAAHLGGKLTTNTLDALAARQTGMYARLSDLTPQQRTAMIDHICAGCICQPTWFTIQNEGIPCPEACNFWMSRALEDTLE